jgi:hypothetical protein
VEDGDGCNEESEEENLDAETNKDQVLATVESADAVGIGSYYTT